MDDCEERDEDIYNDLPDFRYDETIDKLNATIAKLEEENNELQSKLTEMKKEKETLEANCSVLSTNITSLLKTAKFELQRKDRTISDLRQQLNETGLHSMKFGVKRQFENTNSKYQNTEIRYTSKKDSQTCEPASKKPRFSESDKLANHSVSRNEESTNGNLSSLKPSAKTTHSSQKENVPLASSRRVIPVEEMDTIPKIAAPTLPIIDCPTVFSARMYQRLYNTGVTRAVTLPGVPFIPTGSEEPLNRVSEEKTKTEQQKRAIESEKTVSKIPDGALKLPSSPLFSQKPSITTTEAILENLSSTAAKNYSTVKRSELTPSLVSEPKKVISKSVTNNDSQLFPSNKCEVGKIESDSARSVIQLPNVSALSSKVHSTECQDSTLKTKKQKPKPHRTVSISEKHSKLMNTNGSQLKITPHLKGKSSTRKTFVPISNAWNCLKPPSSVPADETSTNKCQQRDDMVKGEICCTDVTCVTSELTFIIDDEELDERRKLELDLFGSPVKWADDCSSDSVKVDGSAIVNRKKILYSIFGSPYKNGDSCSSEPYNFILPPGAYEDSCWTNQPSDKASPRPIKPPTPSLPDSSSNLVASKDKSSESTSRSNDRDDEKKGISLPPPARPIGKKNQSVFSPLRDSKTATSLPSVSLDDRSSTGICFPFKTATRYEDSVLGQFDDTAQFVSALAKVDTKISPLSTPSKNLYLIEESLTSQPKKIDSLPINNPTSFKEVFQNKILQDAATVPSIDTPVVTEIGSSKPSGEENTNAEPHASTSVGTKESSLAPEQSQKNEENVCNIDGEVGLSNASPSTLSSYKFIHRSNFSSSSVFTMSSDSQSFLDKPVNVLQPRKAPRAVINKRSPVALNGSCKDVKLNPRIAIPDAFITEQEERVRKWQKNHLYETTLKIGSTPKMPSPTKGQVKIHSSSSDLMKPSSPTKAQSKMFSPGQNRMKTSTPCKGLEASSVSITQVKTDVINQLQPKRVPRHPVVPKKNCDELLKCITTTVKPEGVTTGAPPRVLVDDAPCGFDSTIKALNMIRSVVDKSVTIPDALPLSTSDEKDEAVYVPPVMDAVHNIKTEPINNENSCESPNYPPKKDLVAVTCKQRSSKYVEVVSQIKPNTPKTSITKLRVSKRSVSSTSLSSAIIIKKSVVRRDSDFKRSSALKKPGDKARDHAIGPITDSSATTEQVLESDNTAKYHLPSNRKLIRRKSAPNLHVSSQHNETKVTSKTPIKSSSSTYLMEKRKVDAQVPTVPTADTINPSLHVSSQHNETRVTSKTPTMSSSSTYLMEKRKGEAQVPTVPYADTVNPNLHVSSQHNETTVASKTPIKSASSTHLMENIKGEAQVPTVPFAGTVNPNLHVSSQHSETRITSKTPIKSSSSAYLMEKRKGDAQFPTVLTADTINPIKWMIHPIELGIPNNTYEFITSSFSSNDPRALPRPIKPQIHLITEDGKYSKEDNQYVRTVEKPNLGHPNEFSPNVSAISRAGEKRTADSRANLTRPVVTSTPFPMKASRRLAPKKKLPDNTSRHASEGEANSHPRGSSSSNETVSSKTPTKILIVKKDRRAAGRTSILLDAPVKQETRGRRRKLPAETQPELTSPKENCKEPTKRPENRISQKIPKSSTSDKLAAAPLQAERVAFASATSPEHKPVVLNYSNQGSKALLSHSVTSTSTVQPKLISRKRRNPNFSSVTIVHSDRPVIIPRKRQASFTVNNSST